MPPVNPRPFLDEPLSTLPGVGPTRAARLAQKGLRTVRDLLFFSPLRYEDRTGFTPVSALKDGERVLVRGTVVSGEEEPRRRGRRPVFRIVIRDRGTRLTLVWFHFRKAHLQRLAVPGGELVVYGRAQRAAGGLRMAHPEVLPPSSEPPGIHPVYSTVQGVPDKVVRSAVRAALERVGDALVDPVPKAHSASLGLPTLRRALTEIHRPSDGTSASRLNRYETRAHRRLCFDRFLGVMLALQSLRDSRQREGAPALSVPEGALETAESGFPFRFTPDQASAVESVYRDLKEGRLMNRLIMGDVGCGKTAVAAAAAHLCTRGGAQVALMAPTRILAEQHAGSFSALAGPLGFHVGLLTGSLGRIEREELLESVRSGRINLIVGTHALAREDIPFRRLGLAVIDEQQRFGVRVRSGLLRRKRRPHLLVLTATPIPRTLAMAAYGDLDISVIRERPAGYRPVETKIVGPGEKRALAASLSDRMSAGQQVIVVCPAVEASGSEELKNVEEMRQGLNRLYGDRFRVGAVHGRMPEEERLRTMDGFRAGTIHLLVATTVIEVGVHVPNATTLVVEHPERFGLAQLHQLRGRVGRGAIQGVCYLVPPPDVSGDALRRLKILEETADGFRISEQDLLLRGQGELGGIRQAGPGELDVEEVLAHPDLLEAARRTAELLFREDPGLRRPEHAALRRMAEDVLSPGPDPSRISP